MSEYIVFTKLDESADEILDAFAERTGLEGEDDGDTRSFPLHGTDHEVKVVETLTAIDEHWPHHVGLEIPS